MSILAILGYFPDLAILVVLAILAILAILGIFGYLGYPYMGVLWGIWGHIWIYGSFGPIYTQIYPFWGDIRIWGIPGCQESWISTILGYPDMTIPGTLKIIILDPFFGPFPGLSRLGLGNRDLTVVWVRGGQYPKKGPKVTYLGGLPGLGVRKPLFWPF